MEFASRNSFLLFYFYFLISQVQLSTSIARKTQMFT